MTTFATNAGELVTYIEAQLARAIELLKEVEEDERDECLIDELENWESEISCAFMDYSNVPVTERIKVTNSNDPYKILDNVVEMARKLHEITESVLSSAEEVEEITSTIIDGWGD